ncbi:MAG: alpha/beta hydrolase [Planctomycetales bacterium]|nr:alpha/beta hydrolase [Planctomycetales bacterium]
MNARTGIAELVRIAQQRSTPGLVIRIVVPFGSKCPMIVSTPRSRLVLAAVTGGLVIVMISGLLANYHDGHDQIVFAVTFILCNVIAFWHTRHQGWQSVFTVGAVTAALVLVSIVAAFPRLPDQVLRAQFVKGMDAGLQLGKPFLFPIACLPLLTMAFASAARYVMGRRVMGATVSILTAVMVLSGMVAYARTINPRAPISHRPPLGVSVDEVLQAAEQVPPEWQIDPMAEDREGPTAVELRDIEYGPHGWRNQLNLFRPTNVNSPVPVVVYIHGGWVIGDKDHDGYVAPWVHALLRNGIAIAPINYRLAASPVDAGDPNGVPFPAQIQDCYAAIRFLRANAAEYSLDPNNIAVMGHSGGGHLAALVGLASDVEEFNNDGWNLEIDHRVKAAISLAGPTNLCIYEKQTNLFLQTLNQPNWEYVLVSSDFHSTVGMLIGAPLRYNMKKAYAASPVSHVSSDDPPLLLVHGFRDAVVAPHQAELLHCELRAAGVESELHIIPGAGHFLGEHPGIATPIVDFLQKHLR